MSDTRDTQVMPDVAGYTYGEARIMLEKAGITVRGVKSTRPPRWPETACEDDFRVIRADMRARGCVDLLVCKVIDK